MNPLPGYGNRAAKSTLFDARFPYTLTRLDGRRIPAYVDLAFCRTVRLMVASSTANVCAIFRKFQPADRSWRARSRLSTRRGFPMACPDVVPLVGAGTMPAFTRQPFQNRDNRAQRNRSGAVRFGRFTERCKTLS